MIVATGGNLEYNRKRLYLEMRIADEAGYVRPMYEEIISGETQPN
jgi:hypothetical protein